MTQPHKIWIEQCEAAESDAEVRTEIPMFVEKIKTIFERWQLAQYLETARETEPFNPST